MADAYQRFVALGDSQTEGLNDFDERGEPVGWADRLARAVHSTTSPGLTYANLAVRGARAADVYEKQLPAALELRPDLATVVVGMNDVLRHDYDADRAAEHLESTFAALTASGCHVVTMTFPDIGAMLPILSRLRPRQEVLNARLRAAAERHGVAVLDLVHLDLCSDPAIWSHDRIHGSRVGHQRIAAAVAALLGLPGAAPTWATPGDRVRPDVVAGRFARWVGAGRDAHWLATFAVPFVARQVLRRGSERLAKRPALMPLQHNGRPVLSHGTAAAG